MRRTPLRRRSHKARARDEARRACVAAVIRRDKVCQFPVLLARFEAEHGPTKLTEDARRCRGWPLTAHEPKHRRNVDPTDPANCIAMCPWHNGFLETLGGVAYEIGFLVRGVAEPYRRRG